MKPKGKKVIYIIKDGILMAALDGATVCQTALILTFKILLCNVNKILLTQGGFFGMLPSNSPKISEANAMMCFQTGCQMDPKKGCSLQTTVRTSSSLANDRYENNKIFSQVHKHRDDTLTGDQILPSLVPQIFAYSTNMVTLRNVTPNTP